MINNCLKSSGKIITHLINKLMDDMYVNNYYLFKSANERFLNTFYRNFRF